jgi:hypothetical protein
MAEEEVVSTEEVEQEPVAATETAEPEQTEQTEQETQPVENVEKSYTKAEVEEIMAKRVAREKRKLQREMAAEKPKAEVSTQKQDNPPKLDDFETTEEYLDARADWKVEQRLAAEAQKAEEEKEKKATEKLVQKFEKQKAKMAEKYSDFDDLMDDLADLDIPPYINQAVIESDIGGELSYYLAKNPIELEKILDMQPLAAVKALGRLETKLESTPAKKEVSKAPAPFKTVKGDSKPSTMEISPKDDFETFRAKRNYQLGRTQ